MVYGNSGQIFLIRWTTRRKGKVANQIVLQVEASKYFATVIECMTEAEKQGKAGVRTGSLNVARTAAMEELE